jgi:TolB-like protein/class 3 adenylate cyclase/tetratricopeptide (TPR) repeat protein
LTTERVERRLAAVLAADVAGYSRLMGIDEEGTLARLKAVRKALVDPAIASHRGRIVKTTGDGMLVEFASAIDAARCAVEVQRGMAAQNADVAQDVRIEFRIGIHVGDIIFDENDIFGDGVNIAARLEGIAEPGGLCISSSAYEQVRGKVAVEFADLGEQKLKNIARPIRAFAVIPNGREVSTQGAGNQSPASASPLAILVLPFANIGNDPEQSYFADGVTESLTTDLSRISGAFVIARNTAFTFKDKAVDVKQVGRELNVRYVLEGSVQRGDNRLRLNVQLIETATGKHLWADRFDKPVTDLFEMQDEIVSRLANTLDGQLVVSEAQRVEHLLNPTAIDLYFQGRASLNKAQTPQSMAQARGFFERALVLDPNNIEALVGRATVDTIIGYAIMTDDRAVHLQAAEATSIKVLSMNPQHPTAHMALGAVQIATGRALQGIAECERVLALDHNLATAHALIGLAKHLLGRSAETEAHVNEALRLSPRDAFVPWWMNWLGFSKFHLKAYAEAANCFRKSIEHNRNNSWGHFGLACTLVGLGDLDGAKAALREGLALDRDFTLQRLRANLVNISPVSLEGRNRFLESMRLAGTPEG